jgi:hypothetical protein
MVWFWEFFTDFIVKVIMSFFSTKVIFGFSWYHLFQQFPVKGSVLGSVVSCCSTSMTNITGCDWSLILLRTQYIRVLLKFF